MVKIFNKSYELPIECEFEIIYPLIKDLNKNAYFILIFLKNVILEDSKLMSKKLICKCLNMYPKTLQSGFKILVEKGLICTKSKVNRLFSDKFDKIYQDHIKALSYSQYRDPVLDAELKKLEERSKRLDEASKYLNIDTDSTDFKTITDNWKKYERIINGENTETDKRKKTKVDEKPYLNNVPILFTLLEVLSKPTFIMYSLILSGAYIEKWQTDAYYEEHTGINIRTIENSIKELADLNLIVSANRKGKDEISGKREHFKRIVKIGKNHKDTLFEEFFDQEIFLQNEIIKTCQPPKKL